MISEIHRESRKIQAAHKWGGTLSVNVIDLMGDFIQMIGAEQSGLLCGTHAASVANVVIIVKYSFCHRTATY